MTASTGKGSRAKGATAERELRDIFREAGYECERTPHSGSLEWMKGDLSKLPWHVEAKRQEATRIDEWHTKACEESGDKPALLIYRRSRQPWRVVLLLADFLRLMEKE